MSTAIAKNLMAEMKLLGMLAAFDTALGEATRDKTSYSELLDTLLQAEADYRQERKTGYRIKAARFTLRPAFEDVDFTASARFSSHVVSVMYNTDLPQAQAWRPAAWARNVLPTPVCPISSTGRASFNHCRLYSSLICVLVIERLAVKSTSSKAGRSVNLAALMR